MKDMNNQRTIKIQLNQPQPNELTEQELDAISGGPQVAFEPATGGLLGNDPPAPNWSAINSAIMFLLGH